MKHLTKDFRLASFKALDQAQGVFEAIVAVFGNVDRAGDKILPGAFAKSLTKWAASADPIPVIFAHEWDNLDAHIGKVLDAQERPAGLYVKGQLEMDEPFAARVWKKMQDRTLKQFSFAYDVVDATMVKGQDGAYVNELRELDLLEVGPCLVGMNTETQLLGVKRERESGGAGAENRDERLEIRGEKEGRRNAAKDLQRIQAVHDLVCELGAKCAGADIGDGSSEDEAKGEAGDGKPKGLRPSTLAARVAVELLELGSGSGS